MRTFSKYATAVAIAGTLALAATTPSQARWGGHQNGAAAAIGFGAGALVGAAAASAAYPGYYDYYDYGPDYAYAPGAYDDSYDPSAYPTDGSYAYAPGSYAGPHGPGYSSHRAPGCVQSPASMDYTSCD